ncbi:hypothetical protein VP01_2360g1 [Puccinia sorghi]|uniref:Uncharacterized protein n=1 Tax=Puccinia sorghi TaxID=27349 RepID=A0A0L6V7C9_9BASI|nr:hypothetical protein VP01_2360g1 [Puccinia sorghi]
MRQVKLRKAAADEAAFCPRTLRVRMRFFSFFSLQERELTRPELQCISIRSDKRKEKCPGIGAIRGVLTPTYEDGCALAVAGMSVFKYIYCVSQKPWATFLFEYLFYFLRRLCILNHCRRLFAMVCASSVTRPGSRCHPVRRPPVPLLRNTICNDFVHNSRSRRQGILTVLLSLAQLQCSPAWFYCWVCLEMPSTLDEHTKNAYMMRFQRYPAADVRRGASCRELPSRRFPSATRHMRCYVSNPDSVRAQVMMAHGFGGPLKSNAVPVILEGFQISETTKPEANLVETLMRSSTKKKTQEYYVSGQLEATCETILPNAVLSLPELCPIDNSGYRSDGIIIVAPMNHHIMAELTFSKLFGKQVFFLDAYSLSLLLNLNITCFVSYHRMMWVLADFEWKTQNHVPSTLSHPLTQPLSSSLEQSRHPATLHHQPLGLCEANHSPASSSASDQPTGTMDALNARFDKMMRLMAKERAQRLATEETLRQTQAHLNAVVGQPHPAPAQQNPTPLPPPIPLLCSPNPNPLMGPMALLLSLFKVVLAILFMKDYAATWSAVPEKGLQWGTGATFTPSFLIDSGTTHNPLHCLWIQWIHAPPPMNSPILCMPWLHRNGHLIEWANCFFFPSVAAVSTALLSLPKPSALYSPGWTLGFRQGVYPSNNTLPSALLFILQRGPLALVPPTLLWYSYMLNKLKKSFIFLFYFSFILFLYLFPISHTKGHKSQNLMGEMDSTTHFNLWSPWTATSQAPWIRSYATPLATQYTSTINHTYYITNNTHNIHQ